MNIDIKKLQHETKILRSLIEKYRPATPNDFQCFEKLNPTFREIENGKLSKPYEEDPCTVYFFETSLGNYRDLETAYSNFLFTVGGGDEKKLEQDVNRLLEKKDN